MWMYAQTSSEVKNPFGFEQAAETKSVWKFYDLDQGSLVSQI